MPVLNSSEEFKQFIIQKLQSPRKVNPALRDGLGEKIQKIVKPKKEVKL